jgi:uncharacterized membrane protein
MPHASVGSLTLQEDVPMESRIKVVGHPVHPILIVFPFGLFASALIFDIAYVLTSNADLATFSFWALIGGLIGGLAAAVFGFVDWLAIPGGTRAKRIGAWHGGGNLVVVAVFLFSLLSRWSHPAYLPEVLPAILALVGGGLALVTTWLGGELVYRMGVGIDTGANLDASNSIAEDGVVSVRT